MQKPLAAAATHLPIETPVTRLMSALQEADSKLEDTSSRTRDWGAILSFLIAVVGLFMFLAYEHFWNAPLLVYGAVAAVGGGVLGSLIATFFGSKELWRELKRFEHDLLVTAEVRIRERLRLAERIGGEFDAKQISFAKAYLQAACQNLKSRIGLVIGALEKVGIIPLAASTLVALAKMYDSSPFASVWCVGALVLLLLYLCAMRMLGAAYTIERLLLVLDHAEIYAAERASRKG